MRSLFCKWSPTLVPYKAQRKKPIMPMARYFHGPTPSHPTIYGSWIRFDFLIIIIVFVKFLIQSNCYQIDTIRKQPYLFIEKSPNYRIFEDFNPRVHNKYLIFSLNDGWFFLFSGRTIQSERKLQFVTLRDMGD